ncbi:Protein FAR1-RELATED SEQUENCE [Arachis hypogaea]|nr:Protein FAR1-RELATED SEQUENCE [Arachis hypogaea]
MYEEKHMWATVYIRGKFFAGFRTTSRCEGLHSIVARYVGSRHDLTSFVEHFQRCVAHMRFKEFNADYESTRGVPVMKTCIELLERYAAELYTHEIFRFFRPFLSRAGSMRVLNIENNDDGIKYIMCKHGRPDFMWTIDFRQEEMIFMCTCLRMESFGIPCEHIVKVLVDIDICEIPRSLVLDRWTKKVKSALIDPSGFTRDAVVISRQSALMEFSKQLAAVAAKVPERYEETRDLIMGLYSSYKAVDEGTNQPHSDSHNPRQSPPTTQHPPVTDSSLPPSHRFKSDMEPEPPSQVRLGTARGAEVVKVAVMALYALLIAFGLCKALPLASIFLCALTLPIGNLDKSNVFMAKYFCVRLHALFGAALACGLVAARVV